MLKIGIIGAENSHCAAIAKLCNVHKKVAARVTMVWGETPKFAKAAAESGQIPAIVRDWREMAGQVDGVMIDHRHSKYHAEPATFFLERSVPCFVDKPFTFTLAEGRRLCALARQKRVPVTSFSTIRLQRNFAEFKKAAGKIGGIVSLATTGPVELNSKYGGVFFYGIHQVEVILDVLGTRVRWVRLERNGKGGVATLAFENGALATMHCINNGNHAFHWAAVGDKEMLDWKNESDASHYLTGAKTFIEMFRTGKAPYSDERILGPIAVLEALAKSLRTGKRVRLSRL